MYMVFNLNLPKGTTERERALEREVMFRSEIPMFYRTTVRVHSARTVLLLEELLPFAKQVYGSTLDETLVLAFGAMHDDLEIETGDVTVPEQRKMGMGEWEEHVAKEAAARNELVRRFGTGFYGFDYGRLLDLTRKKFAPSPSLSSEERLATQLVGYVEKVCESGCLSIHELFAGNTRFVGEPHNVIRTYDRLYAQATVKFPELAPLLAQSRSHPLLQRPQFDWMKVAEEGTPHTEGSIFSNSGHPMYEVWKKVTLSCNEWYEGFNGLELLTRVSEEKDLEIKG